MNAEVVRFIESKTDHSSSRVKCLKSGKVVSVNSCATCPHLRIILEDHIKCHYNADLFFEDHYFDDSVSDTIINERRKNHE